MTLTPHPFFCRRKKKTDSSRGSEGACETRGDPSHPGLALQNAWMTSTVEQKPTGRMGRRAARGSSLPAKPSFGPKAWKARADVSVAMGSKGEADRECRVPASRGVPGGAVESGGYGSLPRRSEWPEPRSPGPGSTEHSGQLSSLAIFILLQVSERLWTCWADLIRQGRTRCQGRSNIGLKSPNPERPVHPSVHCSVAYNSQEVEAPRVSLDRQPHGGCSTYRQGNTTQPRKGTQSRHL